VSGKTEKRRWGRSVLIDFNRLWNKGIFLGYKREGFFRASGADNQEFKNQGGE